MKTMKLFFVSLICIMTFNANAQTQTHTLQEFDEVKVLDQINVTLIKSSENKAVVSGEEAGDVKIENNSGKLKVHMELDDFLGGNENNVKLYYSGELEMVEAKQGATINSDDTVETSYLVVNSRAGSNVDLTIDTRNLEIKVVSGGDLTVSGNATDLEVTVRSGGDYHGEELDSERATVSVFAGGGAKISADEYIDASVTAGGTIEIYGSPEEVITDETFGGTITEM